MAQDASRQRLGKGLAALIGDLDEKHVDRKAEADRDVPIEWVRANANNPRRVFGEEELEELAGSIAEHGVVQPILVRPVKGEVDDGAEYEIIAGERRWRAAQRAGLERIPVLIRDVGDRQALELAIIENVQRTDLDPIDEANGYQQLIDGYGHSQTQLAQIIGKSRSHVANTLRLLKLPDRVRNMIRAGALTAGHARALITADDPDALAKIIADKGLSVRETERLAQQKHNGTVSSRAKAAPQKPAETVALERRLESALGLAVVVNDKGNGSGQVQIGYRTLEQLDEICRRLAGE